jgi:hypothetical protein
VDARLYILILSAILVLSIPTTTAADSNKGRAAPKQKVRIVLVDKQQRDRSDRNGRTERRRSEDARRRRQR